jgi:hypothetical protein
MSLVIFFTENHPSMATIKKFEEILSWKEAREPNRVVGKTD